MSGSRVLCVPAINVAEAAGISGPLPPEAFWCADDVIWTRLFREARWIDRAEAEENPRWKQVIPYVVLRGFGSSVLSYRRPAKGGDGRLKGKVSIGIGGHVEERLDRQCAGTEWDLTGVAWMFAAIREVKEETGAWIRLERTPVGIVNNETDDVGRVHLGIVLAESGPPIESLRPSPELAELGYRMPEEFQAEECEAWTRIILDLDLPK